MYRGRIYVRIHTWYDLCQVLMLYIAHRTSQVYTWFQVVYSCTSTPRTFAVLSCSNKATPPPTGKMQSRMQGPYSTQREKERGGIQYVVLLCTFRIRISCILVPHRLLLCIVPNHTPRAQAVSHSGNTWYSRGEWFAPPRGKVS